MEEVIKEPDRRVRFNLPAAAWDDGVTRPVRYIKLGPGGRWTREAFAKGEVHFGHRATPHEVALAGREAILRHLEAMPQMKAMATQYARQIDEFYRLPRETVWVTFEGGDLWWAQAETEVMILGETETNGHRMRRTIAPWCNRDLKGRRLRMDSLSTRLTKVAGSQQTLCNVSDPAYLLRKIRGEEEPAVRRANEALAALEASAVTLIAGLHQDDIETLIDLTIGRAKLTFTCNAVRAGS